MLRDDLRREAPALERLLHPPRWRGPVVAVAVAAAAVSGALTNALGPARHVSVLAFPLAGILAWNLLVYAALVARTAARARGRRSPTGRLGRAGGWLEGAWLAGLARRLGVAARSALVADAVRGFARLWLPTAAPLIAARVQIVLHLAALAVALGALAGMYVSGIALEYRATWETTWLDARAVQRYLDTLLGPAARVLVAPVPDVALLRGPTGEGPAAPWIHLWAATLVLVVVIPRAALALVDAAIGGRLARWLPVEIDVGYARRALHSGRGVATRVEVVYYSCAPGTPLRERLHTTLQEEAGARAAVRDAAQLEYGDAPIVSSWRVARSSGLIVVVFPLAQTPEADVHGEFVEGLRRLARLAGSSAWSSRRRVSAPRRLGGTGPRAPGHVGAPAAGSRADRDRARVAP